jgi:prepilin-type N-terminal cleavage/methylation domain-containing protein
MRELVKYSLFRKHGYSMLEVLVVAIIITILATIPIVSLRKAKAKANEIEAIAALNMMAVAYESYNSQARPHRYPHYLANGIIIPELIDYRNAEEIWDDLIQRSLIPRRFSNHSHDEYNLLARGFYLTILPYSVNPGYSTSPRYSYAMVMMPNPNGQQPRAIAIFQGYHDGWMRVSPRARKLPGNFDMGDSKFYTWKDF